MLQQIRKGMVWIISDKMPQFLITSLNYTDINFRILTMPLADAIAGTVCDNTPWKYIGSNILWWDR